MLGANDRSGSEAFIAATAPIFRINIKVRKITADRKISIEHGAGPYDVDRA